MFVGFSAPNGQIALLSVARKWFVWSFFSDINSESKDLSGQLLAIAETFDLRVAVVLN